MELGPGGADPRLAAAEREPGVAVEDLRRIAQGLHTSLLTDSGLAVAVAGLSESRPLDVAEVPPGRFADVVALTVYLLVERLSAYGPLRVAVSADDAEILTTSAAGREPRRRPA